MKKRSPKNLGKGYRFIITDRGRKYQLRWDVYLYRNGLHIYSTRCTNSADGYHRAVKACLDFLYFCREIGTYNAQQAHITLARRRHAAAAEYRATQLKTVAANSQAALGATKSTGSVT